MVVTVVFSFSAALIFSISWQKRAWLRASCFFFLCASFSRSMVPALQAREVVSS